MGPGVRGRDDAPGNLVGVWGRARPAGSGLERERVNVAPRVKEAMGVVRLPLEWESSSVEVLAPWKIKSNFTSKIQLQIKKAKKKKE